MTPVIRAIALAACSVMLAATLGSAAQIDSKAVEFIAPENIKWVEERGRHQRDGGPLWRPR